MEHFNLTNSVKMKEDMQVMYMQTMPQVMGKGWPVIAQDEVLYPIFNHKTEMKEPRFQLGMLFPINKIFRDGLK